VYLHGKHPAEALPNRKNLSLTSGRISLRRGSTKPPLHWPSIAAVLTFENDKEFPPLQAADLIAWWLRRHWLEHGSVTGGFPELPWSLTRQLPMMCLDMGYHDILEEFGPFKSEHSLTVTFSSDL
ncbi:MAG: DUF3800 domain-containing protein, partial [Rhodobacteraceae bacterium]|nr:DUF3800 domain-containing protein [Paracoccaceae bacterium]